MWADQSLRTSCSFSRAMKAIVCARETPSQLVYRPLRSAAGIFLRLGSPSMIQQPVPVVSRAEAPAGHSLLVTTSPDASTPPLRHYWHTFLCLVSLVNSTTSL